MSVSRRNFIKTAGIITLGFSGLRKLFGENNYTTFLNDERVGYGELIRDPNGIFDLPPGFSYKIISRAGDKMSDGFLVPGLPDGMASFEGDNERVIIIRNHELNTDSDPLLGPFGKKNHLLEKFDRNNFYDSGQNDAPALGGTTTIIFNTKTQQVEKQYLSLAGTLRNCAGGPTPWNSWITCEETNQKNDGKFLKDHGYVFEVPASSEIKIARPVPLKGMGRFVHEAIAVDPFTDIIYLTEDREDGLIYRFIPKDKKQLHLGGKLQALKVKGAPGLDTRNWITDAIRPGDSFNVEWIDIDNVESPDDDLRFQGFEKGAAKFARGEGMWYGRDAVYFACTTGGRLKKGQIWRYFPGESDSKPDDKKSSGKLNLFVEPNDPSVVENADNLTISPWGDVFICEDGPDSQYLVSITPEGKINKFGKNAVSFSELAGVNFSPDGSTLFFNIQRDGLTLSVTGPWK